MTSSMHSKFMRLMLFLFLLLFLLLFSLFLSLPLLLLTSDGGGDDGHHTHGGDGGGGDSGGGDGGTCLLSFISWISHMHFVREVEEMGAVEVRGGVEEMGVEEVVVIERGKAKETCKWTSFIVIARYWSSEHWFMIIVTAGHAIQTTIARFGLRSISGIPVPVYVRNTAYYRTVHWFFLN